MLSHISWQAYWLCLACIIVTYYIVLLLTWKLSWIGSEIKKIIGPRPSRITPPIQAAKKEIGSYDSPPWDTEQDFSTPPSASLEHAVYSCMDEVTALLEEMKKQKCIKEELLFSLFEILSKYPSIKESEFKDSVSDVIISECKSICSIQLGPEEVGGLWRKG